MQYPRVTDEVFRIEEAAATMAGLIEPASGRDGLK